MNAVELPLALRSQIIAEAGAALPRECCGLLEGACDGTDVRVTALHPLRNLSTEPDRFEIDPADQFRLMHAARAAEREIVGCYHSHPNGAAEPSPRDAEFAFAGDFVWLVAAGAALGAFAWDGARFLPVPLADSAPA